MKLESKFQVFSKNDLQTNRQNPNTYIKRVFNQIYPSWAKIEAKFAKMYEKADE
jgi:hypothetical protein